MNVSFLRIRILMWFVMLFAVTEISVVCAQFCEKDDEEAWSYHGSTNGPNVWKNLFPVCGGSQQSPVRIETDLVRRDRKLQKLDFKNYEISVDLAEIVNNGHTVTITPRDGVRRGIFVDGVPFTLEQIHFHWGSVERPGAEHTINHIRYPMEVHFVHRNIGNKTAVVGLLVEVQNGYNEAFIPIIQVLPEVKYKGESTYLQSRLTLSEMLPENPASFYRYIGSLTTPPCDEGVIWSILRKTTYVGRHQLDYFLRLYSVARKDRSRWCLLAENYRPTFTPRKISASQ